MSYALKLHKSGDNEEIVCLLYFSANNYNNQCVIYYLIMFIFHSNLKLTWAGVKDDATHTQLVVKCEQTGSSAIRIEHFVYFMYE